MSDRVDAALRAERAREHRELVRPMTEQRPVRERLREPMRQVHARHDLAHDLGAWPHACALCEAVTTIDLLLDELDTLERRVRAAEGALREAADHNHDEGDHEGYGGPARFEDCSDPYCQKAKSALYPARSLISGTKEPTDG